MVERRKPVCRMRGTRIATRSSANASPRNGARAGSCGLASLRCVTMPFEFEAEASDQSTRMASRSLSPSLGLYLPARRRPVGPPCRNWQKQRVLGD